MHKKIIILIITLILISGCSETKIEKQKTITFTIPEESNVKTYSVEEENPEFWLIKTRDKRNELNEWYYYNSLEDEEKDRLIDKRTRNWRRVIDNELIVGYDEEEDELFYKFKTIEELRDC